MRLRAGSIVIAAFMASLLLGAPAAHAIAPTQLPTPQLEARYIKLINGFRCMQCQDESLANSTVVLAAEMRRQIRNMLLAGKTDQQIRDFMVSRYTNFILFKPPFDLETAWLWLAPGVILVAGTIVALVIIRRRAALVATDPQDDDLMES
ncbi:MAG: cytochrome c-type biogenesis protein [Steroidobacteraceae bacterium]